MPHGETIINALRGQKELEAQIAFDFASKTPNRPYTVNFSSSGVLLALSVEDFGRYGVMVKEIKLTREEACSAEEMQRRFSDQLRRLTSELGYLSGPFRLIEQDPNDMLAILRTPPGNQGPTPFYEFELQAGTEAVLRHFHVSPKTMERTRADANISMKSFLKLMDHLLDIFG